MPLYNPTRVSGAADEAGEGASDSMNPSPPSTPHARRRRWWLPALAGLAVAALGLLLLGPIVATRIVASVLSARIEGGTVSIGSIEPREWGRTWLLRDLRIDADGWPGEGGTVVAIDRLLLQVERAPLLRGEFVVEEATAVGVVLRISEDAEDPERIALMGLAPAEGAAGAGPLGLRRVFVDRLRLESGEVREGRWEPRGSRWFSGDLSSSDSPSGSGGAFEFLLAESTPSGDARREGGLTLKGLVDADAGGASVQIFGLDLGEETIRMAPRVVRRWLDRFEIGGRIREVTIAWGDARGDSPPADADAAPRWKATLAIADASLRLEELGQDLWARYLDGRVENLDRAPRMRLHSGQIVISSEGIELNSLRGRFGATEPDDGGVPFALSFAMSLAAVQPAPGEPASGWVGQRDRFARGVALAPFELGLEIDQFRSVPTLEGGTVPIDLPAAAARILAQLAASSWSMDLDVRLRRGPPMRDPGGALAAAPVQSAGTLMLSQGRGSYFRFPYPLEGVDGSIAFQNEVVTIDYIRGRGSGDSDVQISGTLEYRLDDDDVSLSMRISSLNAAADATLLEALDAGPRELLETLFDSSAAAELAAAGLLPDADRLRELEAEQGRIRRFLAEPADPVESSARDRLERRQRRLGEIVAAGPFSLGGRLRLTIDLAQSFGIDAPLRTSGTIDLQRAGVVLKGFPYPLVVTGGRIVLHDERIELEEPRGLEFTTPAGGFGRIRGHIDIPRRRDADGEEARGFEPHLRITVADDEVNAALLAAIPFPERLLGDLEPGASSGWNELLHASGLIDLHGTILPGEGEGGDRDPRWSFLALLTEAAAEPSDSLLELLARSGLEWPRDARLESGSAVIEIDREGVRLRAMDATFDGAGVALSGEWRNDQESLDLLGRFRGLPAARWIGAAASDLDLAQLVAGGEIDCEARWSGGAEAISAGFRLTGGEIELAVPSGDTVRPLRLRLESGALATVAGGVAFEDAFIGLRGREGGEGVVEIDGDLRFAAEATESDPSGGIRPLQGQWRGGRSESAAVQLVAERLLPPMAARILEEARPEGPFDLRFRRESGASGRIAGELAIAFQSIECTLDGHRVQVSADTPLRLDLAGTRLRLDPTLLSIVPLEEGTPSGAETRLSFSLELDSGESPRLTLAADATLPAFPYPGSGLLPRGVRQTVESLMLGSAATRVGPLKFEAHWPSSTLLDDPASFTVEAIVGVEGASFDAGVPFRAVDGEAILRFSKQPGEPASGEVEVRLDRAIVREREVRDATATIRYQGDSERIRVAPIAARVYGGFLHGRVDALLDEDRYELDLLFDEVASSPFLAGEDSSSPGDELRDAGRFRGRFRLGGSLSDASDRVGRGSFSIVAGRLGRLPVGLRILQVAQLSLPIHESLADAEVRFHIAGSRLIFERLDLACETLSLAGEGHLDLETMEIDTRFATRGTTPLVSDLVAPITGTLFAVELAGPVSDPRATVRPLPALAPRRSVAPAKQRETDRVLVQP